MAKFAGDKKVGQSILGPAETKFKNYWVTKIPACIETYHLTLTTILWSAGTVLFGWLAETNIAWIWGVSAMIFMQYITDLFDGAVGRYRNTGLVKWGFFMDHFLDFIFSCSLVFAYVMMSPEFYGHIFCFFGLIICSGAFMVNSFLNFATTNEFEIFYYGIGPTEIRVAYIAMNTVIFFFGVGIFKVWVPILLIINAILLIYLIWKSQWKLWQIDMEAKKNRDTNEK